jgi:hypothetical protein
MELTTVKIIGFNSTAIRFPCYQDCESMKLRISKYPRASLPLSTTLSPDEIVFGGEEMAEEYGGRSASERAGKLADLRSTAGG